jgi:hypothetical protein
MFSPLYKNHNGLRFKKRYGVLARYTSTAASMQALAAALQQQTFQPGTATRLSLPPFWLQEPAAWF